MTLCVIPDCARPAEVKSRGWCHRHYMRWWRWGDTDLHNDPVPLAERFWAKVQKTDTCWLWIGSLLTRGGYGQLGGGVKAHRVSWELHHGPIPDGMHVCHHCDNPPCVNPAHLFLGTSGDNARDKARKGRAPTPGAKLTYEIAQEIRRRHAAGEQGADLATDYGVTPSNIQYILRRDSWTSPTRRTAKAGEFG
jgi:hypothetical protein